MIRGFQELGGQTYHSYPERLPEIQAYDKSVQRFQAYHVLHLATLPVQQHNPQSAESVLVGLLSSRWYVSLIKVGLSWNSPIKAPRVSCCTIGKLFGDMKTY
jgi:hypothetical protein